MSKRHFRPNELLERLAPPAMEMKYTSAQRLEISGKMTVESGDEELAIFFMEGSVTYKVGAESGRVVGKDLLYVPIRTTVELEGQGVATRFGAPCDRVTKFACIKFQDVDADARHKKFGKAENSTLRNVWNYIEDDFDSSRLLVGMCQGSEGGWTAWPPHEHAAQREETYVYFGMGDSFAIQCVYDDMEKPYDVAMVLEGDLIAIPKGYHPNCGCPKGGISYIYCMVSTKAEDRVYMDLKIQSQFGDKLE